MAEYILIFVILFVGSVGAYAVYDRYYVQRRRVDSNAYLEALRSLLDNKQESAFTRLRQVVAEDSNNLDAYLRLGKILRDNNKPDRALQVHKDLTLRKGLIAEEKTAVLRELVLDYLALNDQDMAEAALREFIQFEPNSHWAWVQLLAVQQKTAKWEEAYDTAVKVLKLENNKSKKPLAQFKYLMGDDLFKKKEYHKARIHFKEAIGLDPRFVQAYLSIGDSYAEEKRFEDAVSFYTKLIDTVPDQGHLVLERLQTILYDLGRFGEIAEVCETILRSSPDNALARLTLARFHQKKGDLEQAEEMLAALVESHPDHLVAILELVQVYLERGERGKLEALFRRLERRQGAAQARTRGGLADTSLIGIN